MNQKTTIILAVAVILCAAAVYFVSGPSKPTGQEGAKAKALFDPRPEGTSKLELVPWGKPAMVFEKASDKWRITAPIKAPADGARIEGDINRILGLEAVKSWGPKDDGRPSDDVTRLKDQPAWLVKLTDKDGKTRTVRIGAPVQLSRHTYVEVVGDEHVYEVTTDLANEMQSTLDNYREMRVADFAASDVVRVTWSGAQTMSLVKADGKWTIESPFKSRADTRAVEDVLNAVAGARAMRYVEDAPQGLRRFGLAPPRTTLTIDVEKKKPHAPPPGATQPATQPQFDIEKKTIVLQLGTQLESKVFARLDDPESPGVFELPKNVAEQASADVSKLRDKRVITADTFRANRITVTSPAGAVELEKKNGAWQITRPQTTAAGADTRAEFAAVDDLLKAIRDLKASEWELPKAELPTDYGFDNGTAVEVVCEGSLESVKLTIGGQTRGGTGLYVRNDRENSIAVVKPDAVSAMTVGPLAFVERRLLAFPTTQAEKIEIESDGVTRTLARVNGLWSMTAPISAAADGQAVQDLLADLSNLNARTIAGTSADAAKFGLDKPAVRCRITVQPPAPPSTSSAPASAAASAPTPPPQIHVVAATKKDGKAYAWVEGGAKIGEVDDKIFRDLTAEVHERSVVKLDTSKLTGVELTYGGKQLVFDKKGEDWRLEGEPGFKADASKIRGVADALRDLKTTKYVAYTGADLNAYKLNEPSVIAIVRLEGGTAVELRISPDGPPGDEQKRRYATIAGDNKVFLMLPAEVDKFAKQLKDFEPSEAPAAPPPGMHGAP